MYNPVSMYEIAKARQSDLLREADARRLAREARKARPEAAGSSVEQSNAQIVETGERLRRTLQGGVSA